MLKQVALIALAIGTIGVMAETEAESGLLPISIPIIPSVESSAAKEVGVAQVQENAEEMQTVKVAEIVERKIIPENDSNSKRSDSSHEPQRSDEPRQPDGVAKPNLPPNASPPSKQISEPPKTKPAFKPNNKRGDDEESEEPNEKSQSKNKKKGKSDNDEDDNQGGKTKGPNYTVPRRRTQMQGNGSMGEAVPGSVIGALVLFLVVALIQ